MRTSEIISSIGLGRARKSCCQLLKKHPRFTRESRPFWACSPTIASLGAIWTQSGTGEIALESLKLRPQVLQDAAGFCEIGRTCSCVKLPASGISRSMTYFGVSSFLPISSPRVVAILPRDLCRGAGDRPLDQEPGIPLLYSSGSRYSGANEDLQECTFFENCRSLCPPRCCRHHGRRQRHAAQVAASQSAA